MQNKFFLFTIIILVSIFSQAQNRIIQPTPQSITWVDSTTIPKPNTFRLIGEKSADKIAINRLKITLDINESKQSFPIYIGELNDKAIKKYAQMIPSYPEGYYLEITTDKIVIAGADERGTFYGVQTLLQLLQTKEIPLVTIKDYPDVKSRGVVEGFYGTPWSTQARLRQLDFYGDNKLNTYIYGPKDDPYHSAPNWRKPYPAKEAEAIKALVTKANENHVDFVWAIHPGLDIKWKSNDRDSLMAKFEMMYNLGVRAFAVFFDDISGEGTKADKQAELLNYLDDNFVQKKGDVQPLIMCPTEYNKSWSNVAKGYLPTLGKELNKSIEIMWTGDRVISDIDKQGLEWINQFIKRPAYIWWNFPVSDYVRDHLLMGAAYGLDRNNKGLMSGFMTNPMERAEASKIAIYSVADYAWNIEKYNSTDAWKRGIKAVMPKNYEALEFFAKHNSDLGANGHGYRRDESVAFKPIAKKALEGIIQENIDDETFAKVAEEFLFMQMSSQMLLDSDDNKALIIEIKPWLEQFKLMGLSGITTLGLYGALREDNPNQFKKYYGFIKSLKEKIYEIIRTENQNPYQPGVKTASLIVEPFIDSTLLVLIERFNAKYNKNLQPLSNFSPHSLYTNIAQLNKQPLRYDRHWLRISPVLEVVKYSSNAYIGVAIEPAESIAEIKLNIGTDLLPAWAEVQCSTDGKNWKKIEGKINNRHEWIGKPSTTEKQRFVRLLNTSGKTQEAYMKKFEVKIY